MDARASFSSVLRKGTCAKKVAKPLFLFAREANVRHGRYSERYIRDISRKIRANLRFKIERGEYIGHAPFGYRKSATEKNKLCVDEETAAVVKEIFRLYREGYGYGYIAKQLNGRKYPTPSDKIGGKRSEVWSAVAVARILGNRVYAGDTVQGISEKVSFKSKKTRRLPEERWVVTRDTHEAIISREEFEEARGIREGKTAANGLHKGELHAFKGMLYCGGCGSALYARMRSGRPMAYICSNYAKHGRERCTSHSIPEKALLEVIVQEILKLFESEAVSLELGKRLRNEAERDGDAEKEIQKLEQQLLARQRQQDTLYMDKLEGKISEQLFHRVNSGLENKIRTLRDEFDRARNREGGKDGNTDALQYAVRFLEDGRLSYAMLRLLIDKITVYDPGDLPPDTAGGGEKAKMKEWGTVVIDFRFGM